MPTGWVGVGILALVPIACANQRIEPQVASSAAQTGYAMDYPAAAQGTANDFVNAESDVRRITTDFPKYPDQLKNPPWPLVQNVVTRADEAGRSGAYVDARRAYESTHDFFVDERDDISRRVAGSAQAVIKKKECDVDVSGAVAGSLREAVDKGLEKRLRSHNEAHLLIERNREALGRPNASLLEKQADDISSASYEAFIRSIELKAQAAHLLDEASQIRKTLDQSIAEEHAFQTEAGRNPGDKKTSIDRAAKMEDAKVRVDAAVPQLQALMKEIDQRDQAMQQEYNSALDALKKAISARSAAK